MILHLYKTHGDDLQKLGSLLDGVFAFCLVDLKKRKILIGRDAVGVRPLFKISSFGFLAIASEKQGLDPLQEGHSQRKIELFPPGTIEEYTIQSGGKVVLKSINQFVPIQGKLGIFKIYSLLLF
jgi:asparagine synthase (glutamine-hydrolysing)